MSATPIPLSFIEETAEALGKLPMEDLQALWEEYLDRYPEMLAPLLETLSTRPDAVMAWTVHSCVLAIRCFEAYYPGRVRAPSLAAVDEAYGATCRWMARLGEDGPALDPGRQEPLLAVLSAAALGELEGAPRFTEEESIEIFHVLKTLVDVLDAHVEPEAGPAS